MASTGSGGLSGVGFAGFLDSLFLRLNNLKIALARIQRFFILEVEV